MKRALFTMLFVVSLTACGSLGHKFDGKISPNKDEAVVYFYRPSKFIGGGVYYDVKENNQIITTLYNGGYYPHKTSQGTKYYTAKTEGSDEISFPVEKGKIYFVRGKVKMGVLIGRPSLKLVPEDKALQEIQDCRIVEQ